MIQFTYLKAGFVREVKNCLFDRNLFLIALLAPIFYLFLYGSVYMHNVVTKIDVGIVDYDQSVSSRAFCRMLTADRTLHPQFLSSSEAAADMVEQGKLHGYIILPRFWEKHLKQGRQARLALYNGASSFITANELSKRVLELAESYNAVIQQKYWMTRGIPRQTALKKAIPVRIDITPVGNGPYGYSSFLYIALFILILHQLGLIVLSESLAKEKEQRTLVNWKQTSGNRVSVMLISKTLPYLILNFLYFLMLIVIAYPVFHLTVRCSLGQLILLAVPFYLALNGLAWIIGSWFQSQLQAMQLIVISSMPLFLLSGYTWPVYALPTILKPIPFLLPSYPMMMAMQTLTQTGAALWQVLHYFGLLWLQAGIYLWLGYMCWSSRIKAL